MRTFQPADDAAGRVPRSSTRPTSTAGLAEAYRRSFDRDQVAGTRSRSTPASQPADPGSLRRAKNGGQQGGAGSEATYNCGQPPEKNKYPALGNDGCLYKTNIHPCLPFGYFPPEFAWYAYWFGLHPCWSAYWWFEWWPCFAVYPGYVSCYPTYVTVYEDGGAVYYPADAAPADAEYVAAPDKGAAEEVPRPYIDPAFERELAALAANRDAVALMEEGGLHFKEGRYAEAADAFRKAMLAERNNAVPKFALAHALFAQGEYAYAAFLIRRGLEILPNWPEVGADLRDLYGDPADLIEHTIALEVFTQAHPRDPDALLLSGYVAFFSGELDPAQVAFESLAALEGDDPAAAAFLARIAEIRALLEAEGVPNAATGATPSAPPVILEPPEDQG